MISQELKILDGNRPAVSRMKDGIVTFRPSEVGKCIRGLVAALQGHEPEPFDEDDIRVMSQGHIHEPHIAHDVVKEYGGYVQRQIRLTCPLGDFGRLDGTCDGIWFVDPAEVNPELFTVENNGPWHDKEMVYYHKRYSDVGQNPTVFGVEIKASDDSMFDEMSKHGPIEGYQWQVSCYWYMAEHTLGVKFQGILFCVGNRRNGKRSYQFISEPFHTLEEIVDRCRAVTFHAQVGLECANSVKCDRDGYMCKWWKHHQFDHSHDDHPAAKVKMYEFDPHLAKTAIEFYNLTTEAESATLRANHLRDKIKNLLHGREKVSTMGFRIYHTRYTHVAEEAIKDNFPDLYEQFQKKSFDSDAFFKAYPELKDRFTYKGEPTMTIRPNVKELEPMLKESGKSIRTKKPKKVATVANEHTSQEDLIKMAGFDAEEM